MPPLPLRFWHPGRLAHGLPAGLDDAQAVLEGERAGEDEGAVLPEGEARRGRGGVDVERGGEERKSRLLLPRLLARALSTAASPATNSAGCATAVSSSRSFGPSRISSPKSKPRNSFAVLSIRATAGSDATRAESMPTDCAPCPGKSTAVPLRGEEKEEGGGPEGGG